MEEAQWYLRDAVTEGVPRAPPGIAPWGGGETLAVDGVGRHGAVPAVPSHSRALRRGPAGVSIAQTNLPPPSGAMMRWSAQIPSRSFEWLHLQRNNKRRVMPPWLVQPQGVPP